MAMASLCWFWQAGGSIGFGTSCFCFALLHSRTIVRSYEVLVVQDLSERNATAEIQGSVGVNAIHELASSFSLTGISVARFD